MKSIIRYAVLYCALALSAAGAQARPGDDLVGLWGSESTVGPQLRGELILSFDAGTWRARLGGYEASSAAKGDSVRLEFPGNAGVFRGRLRPTDAEIHAFWIQPPGNLVAFATPVTLQRTARNVWRGAVVPLDDHISMYLLVRRDSAGNLIGAFRNPEFNFTGRAAWFRVARNGDKLELTDPATGRQRFRQQYDSSERRIVMDFGSLIGLTPHTREQAVGFFARTSQEPYAYRAPLPSNDGWRTARASAVGLDEARLRSLVQSILDADPAAISAPRIHSVLVARRGTLVLEEYFRGYSGDRPHDLRSASKTFTSIMAGVAVDQGKLSPSAPISRLFAHDSAGGDPRRRQITLEHLLTHTSGMACDDNDDNSPGNEEVMQNQTKQIDWYRYFLELPVAHDPGTLYAYCSAGMNLAGGVVSRATSTWLPAFFDQYLARPLGITHYAMNLTPTGEGYAGGGVHMLPRDLLKFGQLFLDGGTWHGQRIVSKDWVEKSTANRTKGLNATDGLGWHRNTITADGQKYEGYEANGNGGQFLIVVPDLQLAVVFTAGNYGQYQVWGKFRDELTPRFIFPTRASATTK
ncbi:MAG: serine hydrolase domain-containing protein [Gemmatimonadaceae bacterium]